VALLEENPDIMVVVAYAWGRKKYLFVAKVFRLTKAKDMMS